MRFRLSVVVLLTILVGRVLVAQPERGSFEPLLAGSVGAPNPPPPRTVTPPGSYALSIDGDFELGGFVFKDGYPFLHNDGGPSYGNTALGIDALVNTEISDFSGTQNTALGKRALENLTTGLWNVAVGAYAMQASEFSVGNVAVGTYALGTGAASSGTVAIGTSSLLETHYGGNTALGAYSLGILGRYPGADGEYNIAIGWRAGVLLGATPTPSTDLSSNIFVGHPGLPDSAATIFLGYGGTHTETHIAGIHNATLNGIGEHPVCVDDADQLGVCSQSSIRFKSQIASMGNLSASLLDLRPVVFKYKPEAKEGPRPMEYGLIAEEVEEIFPHLVRYDDEGKPLTLRYDLLTPLLLNELQKQNREIQRLNWLVGIMIVTGLAVTVGRWRFG